MQKKHNHYQQSKLSCTIDWNTSKKNLFKTARDIQQVKFLGKQLNLVKFSKHLLSDLDPKFLIVYDLVQILLSQVLQCSIVHLIKQKQPLETMREIKLSILKQMLHLQPKQQMKCSCSCDSVVTLVLCEYRHNVLLGHVRVKVKDLETCRQIFESALKNKATRRALFLTKTGFEVIQLINKFCFFFL